MGRDLRDITGRALQRRTHDAMGRALFHGSPHKGEKKHKQGCNRQFFHYHFSYS